ncbi:MAG: heavy metal translocating P-type ATPase [Candidatus Izemoplasmatales bacterium]|nr:heavy metal translocating P-type ATPase [Candidatus Izemoplasmatales bacterium]
MEKQYRVDGMTCSACQQTIEKTVAKLKGVRTVSVSLINKTMVVDFDNDQISDQLIIDLVKHQGYRAKLAQGDRDDIFEESDSTLRNKRNLLFLSLILLLALFYLSMAPMIGISLPGFLSGEENFLFLGAAQLALTTAIAVINWRFFASGLRSLFHLRPNMDSLVAIGSLAAISYSLIVLISVLVASHLQQDHHLFFEAAGAILTFVSIGKYLEEKSKLRTTSAIRKLMGLTPRSVIVERDGVGLEVSVENLVLGDVVLVKPGMAIPVDGTIIKGSTDIDESLITGEPLPVYKEIGSKVIAGTINKTGAFAFKAESIGSETTLAKIIALVQQATQTKLPIQKVADKISGIFVPVVIAIALITFLVWILVGEPVLFALSNAIAVLVISCPCALGLATPVAIMVATGKGAQTGILLKNPEVLEKIHKLTMIVFDKTNTLTKGEPEITEVINLGFNDEKEMLACAAALENSSEHPIARAIVGKSSTLSARQEIEDFENHPGLGISGTIKGRNYAIGNELFVRPEVTWDQNIDKKIVQLKSEGKTILLLRDDQNLLGIIAVRDEIKPSSYQALQTLKKQNLKLVLLSGDTKANVDIVSEALELDEAYGEMSPKAKSEYLLMKQNESEVVAMVGDGINDAVALTQADIGIAIGAGSDIAISAADIVLMKSDLHDVGAALALSKETLKTIKGNLFWAFGYNLLALPVAAGILYPSFGITLSPMVAAIAMSLSSISVVLNALRLKNIKLKGVLTHENDFRSQ